MLIASCGYSTILSFEYPLYSTPTSLLISSHRNLTSYHVNLTNGSGYGTEETDEVHQDPDPGLGVVVCCVVLSMPNVADLARPALDGDHLLSSPDAHV